MMNKEILKMIIEFTIKRNNATISGFIDTNEIDDESPFNFYTHQGFENGYNVPTNPYNDETELKEWADYEHLVMYWAQDDMFLQFLWDFQSEYRTIERSGYVLIINPYLKEE